MTVRVGINGFGRVGRVFYRIAQQRGIDVVVVNDVADTGALAHLLAYDSTFGRLGDSIDHGSDWITVDDRRFAVYSKADPSDVPWGDLGVDIVIESTGRFTSRDTAARSLASGARKVLISAPGKAVDATIVVGVNEDSYDPARHDVISNASCTTNCVAPMVQVLHDSFGLARGFMTTIHAFTNDQVTLDSPHKDPRRGRTASANIIPTSTGAARSVGLVIPAVNGRLDGVAVRVPVEDGSLVDLAAILDHPATVEQINDAFKDAADGRLKGILRYTTDPVVSRDIIGDPASCVFDSLLTQANGPLTKMFGWYDNEWGYSSRLADLTEFVAARL